MSLKVWLPLNGTLDNQGISNITITNNGTTVNTNGKIGSCYAFDGSDDYISLVGSDLFNIFKGGSNQFSITMWVYHGDATRAILFGDYSTSNSINVNIELKTNHNIRFFWAGSPDFEASANVGITTWNHVAIVYNGTTITIYINGILKYTYTGTLSTKNKTAGEFRLGRDNRTGDTAFNGRLNDFRIYDHALSAAEVHEISQGLILHYKLDEAVGFTDLIARNIKPTIYNNHNNTNMPSTLVENGSYNGDTIWRETCTPTDNSLNSIKTNLSSHGIYNWRRTFSANTKYVFWIYYKPISHLDTRCGGTASNIGGWTEIPPVAIGDGWYRVGAYRNGTVTSDKTDNIFVSFKVPSATIDTPIIIDWASPHLLQGTITIPSYDYVSANITDNSGYGHNGIIHGMINSETSEGRYAMQVNFTANNQYIQCNSLNTSGFGNSYTFAWWGKKSDANTMFWGFQNNIRLNGLYQNKLWNTGDSSSNPLYKPGTTTAYSIDATQYHHYAMMGNGTKCYLYVDGALAAEAKTYKSINGTNLFINGWDSGTNYSGVLSMSDFRIYCTALSAEDIKILYSTGAKIDNKGNVHTYELLEDLGNNAQVKFIRNNATSVAYDETNDTYTVVSPVGTSSWGYGVRLADTPALIVPYGMTYRWTCEVYVPLTVTLRSDYNNVVIDGSAWSGNDNDATGTRLTATLEIPANTWTRIMFGSSNTNSSNSNQLSIRDYSNLGIVTKDLSSSVTWKIRGLQWYLINSTFTPSLKKTGALQSEHLTEGEFINTNISKKIHSINVNQFIER